VENDASGTPQATVTLVVTVLQMPRRTPVSTARFENATPVGSKSTETVTAALTSLGEVMRRALDWTLQQGNAAARTAQHGAGDTLAEPLRNVTHRM
jgi:ABC-type uncharacterized transport system auxiliary subunit